MPRQSRLSTYVMSPFTADLKRFLKGCDRGEDGWGKVVLYKGVRELWIYQRAAEALAANSPSLGLKDPKRFGRLAMLEALAGAGVYFCDTENRDRYRVALEWLFRFEFESNCWFGSPGLSLQRWNDLAEGELVQLEEDSRWFFKKWRRRYAGQFGRACANRVLESMTTGYAPLTGRGPAYDAVRNALASLLLCGDAEDSGPREEPRPSRPRDR